jgi:hypothetical protein
MQGQLDSTEGAHSYFFDESKIGDGREVAVGGDSQSHRNQYIPIDRISI